MVNIMGIGPSSRSRRQTGSPEHNNNNVAYSPDGADGLSVRTAPGMSKSRKLSRSLASFKRIFKPKRWRKSRGSLSASFSFRERDMKVELMNVNLASEEELMTLPCITRALAKNIINHRELIGGFRKIEDIALVSGMGADKLAKIRPEICVTRNGRAAMSLASSKYPSMESIHTVGSLCRTPTIKMPSPVNVNTASIFDLMTIHGIHQALAAKIITYRERRGPFKTVNDLKHAGVSQALLSSIRIYLTTEDEGVDSKNFSTPCDRNGTPSSNGHTRSASAPVMKIKTPSQNLIPVPVLATPLRKESVGLDIRDEFFEIFELLSAKTERPKQTCDFIGVHNGHAAIRLATWNMEGLTKQKVGNSGVLEVITRTIVENGFSIVAVQEVCDENALQKICDELNDPKLPKNRVWSGYIGNWRYVLHDNPVTVKNKSNYLGVLYNVELIDEVFIPQTSEVFVPFLNGSLWQFGVFKVKTKYSSWILINVLSTALSIDPKADPTSLEKTTDPALGQNLVMNSIRGLIEGTDGALIVGSFSAKQAQKGLGDLQDLERVWPHEIEEKNNLANLLITTSLKNKLTGENGVVDDGLRHLAIPKGWSWGGKVTSRGPLWSTLYDLPNDQCPISEPSNQGMENEQTQSMVCNEMAQILTPAAVPTISVSQ